MIVSGFRAALDLDTYPLSNFIRPPVTHSTEVGLVELEISKIVMFLKGVSLSILEGTDAATHSAV